MDFTEGTLGNDVRRKLLEEIERGVEIIRRLDDAGYARSADGSASIGAHIRHNLDFISALLNGVAGRRIDYNARSRNPRVETDREYAAEQLEFASRRLETLDGDRLERRVMVRSEIDEDVWHTSSLSRELEFLHSHTVHHYALIARLIGAIGHEVAVEFGVAPSTLRFRASLESGEASYS